MLLNRVLLPGVHLHLLVIVAHQRLVAVGVRLHGAERGLRQAQAWKTPRAFKHGTNGKHGAGPPRLASIYRLLSEKRAGRRRRPPLRRTAPPTSPGRRTAHGHTKHVSVFEERTGSVRVCLHLTSYPYFSTLEARNAPRMLPTGAQALHRPNTKPRLGLEKTSRLVLKQPRRELKCLQPPLKVFIFRLLPFPHA